MRRRYQIGILLAGVAVTGWILWTVGLATVASNLSMVGTWMLVFIALYLLAQLAFMIGWWVVMDSEVRACGYLKLFGVYLAGDTVNYVVLSGNLGGGACEGLSFAGRARLWSGAHFDCDSQARRVGRAMALAGPGIDDLFTVLPTAEPRDRCERHNRRWTRSKPPLDDLGSEVGHDLAGPPSDSELEAAGVLSGNPSACRGRAGNQDQSIL